MNKELKSFTQQFKTMLPSVFYHNIVTEEELTSYFQWYSQLLTSHEANHYPLFFDWVVSAIGGNKKAMGFLKFYNNTISSLFLYFMRSNGNLPHDIITKTRNSILSKPINKYKEYIGELLVIEYLIKKTESEYEYLGIDFKLGNNKDADIAFKIDSSIQLIEIRNLHNLIGKNLVEIIKKRTKSKLANKTKDLQAIEVYFAEKYPNCEVTLSILIFVWEEYADIINEEFNNVELKKELGDDFLPPITIINQELENGDYLWQICDLENAIQIYKTDNNPNEQKDSKKKDEVLSRRSFFKKAAGMIIPMLGAVVFSGIPSLSTAVNKKIENYNSSPMNCNGSCSGSCSGDCSGSCSSGCSGGCGVACSGYCDNSCGYGCNSSCKGSCKGTCKAQCRDGCTSCKGTCTQACLSGCGRMCSNDCAMGCKTVCEGSCKNTCDYGCDKTCKFFCEKTCKGQCGGCGNGCGNGCGGCTLTCKGSCGKEVAFTIVD